jgi:hypothetical protein
VLSGLADADQGLEDEDLRALVENVRLLADHYNALVNDQIDWKALAIRLAFAHVPGFKVVTVPMRLRGRPRHYDDFALYRAVLGVIDENKTSVANACFILSRRRGNWHGAKPSTLETRFHADKRQVARLARAQAGSPLAPVNASDRPSAKYPQPPPPAWTADALYKRYE